MQTHQQQIEENTKVSCCFARGHLGCSDAAWEGLRHTITTQKSVYTQQVFTHTQGCLHREAFTQSSFLHTEGFTQRSLSSEEFFHTTSWSFYTQKLLHKEVFTQRASQRSFYTKKSLHRETFTHGNFYTQKLLH